MTASATLNFQRPVRLLVLGCVLVCATAAWAQRPLPYSKAEPVWLDFDMARIAEPGEGRTAGYAYDFLYGSIFSQVKEGLDFPGHARRLAGKRKQADNVNTLDEVPDSSWFTNRIGRQAMTLEEIRRGPDLGPGPANGILTVIRGKTVGYQPGFWIVDERGDTYLLKFDPLDYPELATAAEVIATKLFYAIGYNVPQNTLIRFRREQLRLDPDAPFLDEVARRRNMKEADIDLILARVPRQADGSYRAMASKFLAGKDKGSFDFHGMRKDDPNDIIPHEHRRELRALRVFSAWLAHNDIRVANTRDFYVNEAGRQFLRHYLTDFGSALGSESYGPNPPVANNEFAVDYAEAAKSLFSLGIYQPRWRQHPTPVLYRSVGNYTADHFEPAAWKQEFQLPAFDAMTLRDAYWAAKIVSRFTDEQVEAAVAAGQLSDAAAARHLARQIIGRRNKIADYYFSRMPALDEFVLEKRGEAFVLRFRDLRSAPGVSMTPARYTYELTAAAGGRHVLQRGDTQDTEIAFAPAVLEEIAACGRSPADQAVSRLALRRRGDKLAVNVYLYRDRQRDEFRIVGIQHP